MDVLDLVVPELGRIEGLVRLSQGDDDALYALAGTPFARVWETDALDLDYRLPSLSTDLSGCAVLRVERSLLDTIQRARRLGSSAEFDLAGVLRAVLNPQPYWYVWCEREVDTEAVLKRAMPLDECVAEVVARVRGEDESFDFVAWPPERATFVQTRLDWTGRRR